MKQYNFKVGLKPIECARHDWTVEANSWLDAIRDLCDEIASVGKSIYSITLVSEEPIKHHVYLNIYDTAIGRITTTCGTREQADAASRGAAERIACVRVEYKEGQFDD